MTNQDYINAYKGEDRIISDYYKLKDQNGNLVEIDGIVTPMMVDNRQIMAPVDNQKDSPHCAAYSAATIAETINWKKTGHLVEMDAHQIYALAKQMDGVVNAEGTYLEIALEAAIKLGAFEDVIKNPKVGRFCNDKTNKTINTLKRLLHKHDFLIGGFQIDSGWNNVNKNGLKIKKEGFAMGGHAVNIVGYDAESFFIQNQWGQTWGAKGFAMMPYSVLLQELMYIAWVEYS